MRWEMQRRGTSHVVRQLLQDTPVISPMPLRRRCAAADITRFRGAAHCARKEESGARARKRKVGEQRKTVFTQHTDNSIMNNMSDASL